LVLLEPQIDRKSAMRRERAIKTMTRSRKMRLIAEARGAFKGSERSSSGAHRRRRNVSSSD
jgi:predicted GIY-YIG superfamily endonuclease